ncbi:MFS transporter [Alteribacillus iranensis]|uniref:Sugar phosphate permease n=1 Tax=Alteribacillus iranensis TaxID=930128 RepID=A0A1I2BKU5_9BACI|nr:MFS transporter [Alteribacillus iranensis]SFE55883.1 Sugar phosphate permease [Alteribacillus iranensis]
MKDSPYEENVSAPPEKTGAIKKFNPWQMLGWLLVTQVMVAFVGRSIAPLGVFIGSSLSLTNTQIGMLPAALFLGQIAASIPSGLLVDRIGSRALLLQLSLCLGLSFIVATMTSSFILLLLILVIGGIGYGSMHPTSNLGILHWFETRSRGTAMGIKQMGVTAGSALAAIILVPLAASFGWRPVVFGASLLLVAIGLVSFLRFQDGPGFKKTKKGEKKETGKAFLKMTKNRTLLALSSGAIGLTIAQTSLNTYVIIYANQVLGISIALAAALLVIAEVGGSIGRIGWGMISDRLFNGNRMIILMMTALISSIAAVCIALFKPGVPFLFLAIVIFFFGLGCSGFNGLWMNAATEIVPPKQAGLSSGFSLSVGSWGMVIGPPLFGFIVDMTGSFTLGWYILAVILILTAMLYLRIHFTLKKEGATEHA